MKHLMERLEHLLELGGSKKGVDMQISTPFLPDFRRIARRISVIHGQIPPRLRSAENFGEKPGTFSRLCRLK